MCLMIRLFCSAWFRTTCASRPVIYPKNKCKLENMANNKRERQQQEVVIVERLANELVPAAEIEAELIRNGMLSPLLWYIRSLQFERDPMLTILYDPGKIISMPSPDDPQEIIQTTVIDELLRSAHEECKRNYGDLYLQFEFIQATMTDLMASTDTHAKQMTLLCLIAIEKGLQTQLACHYPSDGGPEIHRLPQFIADIKTAMNDTLNTAFVNVPRPTPYNVDNLILVFLAKLSDDYPA